MGVMWLTLVGYTLMVISRHGLDLLPVFFGDIGKMAWPGQFNLDFLCFLVLSAFWTAWRSGFAASGLAFTVLAGGPTSCPEKPHDFTNVPRVNCRKQAQS